MSSYIARQPIVDRNKKTIAFELLYRDGNENSFPNVNSDDATKSILINQFLIHQKRILGGKRGFINFGYDSLLAQIPFDFPCKNYTIEILESCPPSDELYDLVVELKAKGYSIALDDFVPNPNWARFYEFIDIIKFDITTYSLSQASVFLKNLTKYDIKFLAERIETYQEFDLAKQAGFHYFQGYFFSKPEVLHNKVIDSSLSVKIQLSEAISHEDLNVDSIEKIIASDTGLSFKLLTFVNQCSTIKSPIKSLQQALIYLGQDRIRKFVTYAVIKTLNSNKPSALFNMSLQRAKFFELLLEKMALKNKKQLGYLCGMLSTIDALLDLDMPTILEPINISKEIKAALLNGEGILSDIINLVEALEKPDWQQVQLVKEKLKLKESDIIDAFSASSLWADEISE